MERRTLTRRSLLAGVGGAALASACSASPSTQASPVATGRLTTSTAEAGDGWPGTSTRTVPPMELLGRTRTGRVETFRVSTPVLPTEVAVRVLLPASYDSATARRYPVLVLLHGSDADSTDWFETGALESVVGDTDVLVVVPDGGAQGWYLDWRRPSPRTWWETFHMWGVVPSIDVFYRTHGTGAGRAIAGYSMGGFGAVHYAQAYPDMFAAVTTFSGAVSLTKPLDFAAQDAVAVADKPAGAIFGGQGRAELAARIDPPRNASRLRGKRVRLYCGDGHPLEKPSSTDPLETNLRRGNEIFLDTLRAQGVDADLTVLPGGHQFGVWTPALRRDLPELVGALTPARG